MPFSSIAIVLTCSLRKNAMSSMVNRVGSVVRHCYTTGVNCLKRFSYYLSAAALGAGEMGATLYRRFDRFYVRTERDNLRCNPIC
mgnify:CR=1 FL=1